MTQLQTLVEVGNEDLRKARSIIDELSKGKNNCISFEEIILDKNEQLIMMDMQH